MIRATLHVRELAALMAAVRQLMDGAPRDVPEEAREQLRSLLEDYDEQVRRLPSHPGGGRGRSEHG